MDSSKGISNFGLSNIYCKFFLPGGGILALKNFSLSPQSPDCTDGFFIPFLAKTQSCQEEKSSSECINSNIKFRDCTKRAIKPTELQLMFKKYFSIRLNHVLSLS